MHKSKNEKYIRWEPIKKLPLHFICEEIHDHEDGVCIILKEQSAPGSDTNITTKRLKITFDCLISYQNIDESYRLKTFDEQKDRVGSLFTVENSNWINWVNLESYGIYKDSNMIHYSFFTLNECIDVISEFEPAIELL